jgi:hypothetical protein
MMLPEPHLTIRTVATSDFKVEMEFQIISLNTRISRDVRYFK